MRAGCGHRGFADLRGQRLGVAAALDKSWLLLRAYARRTVGEDAASFRACSSPRRRAQRAGDARRAAGGDELLALRARLAAAGMPEVLGMKEILATLDIGDEMPLVGWVFGERWAGRIRPRSGLPAPGGGKAAARVRRGLGGTAPVDARRG